SAEAVPAISAATSVAEISFRTTGRPLKTELFRPAEAGQRRNARIADGQGAESAAHFPPDGQPGDSAVEDRATEAPTLGQLLDNRIGNIFDRAVDQDLLV